MKTFNFHIVLLLLVLLGAKGNALNVLCPPIAHLPESVSEQINYVPSTMTNGIGYKNDMGDPGLRMTVFAGNDTTLCLTGSTFNVHGYATDYYYISWASAGDGFFDNHTQLKTFYTPGPNDIISGDVVLYLIAISNTPTYTRMVDSVGITIVPAPQCFAGYDDSVCSGTNYQLQGEAMYFNNLQWISTGDGTFDHSNQPTPVYTPGATDRLNREVSLLLIANPKSPCTLPNVNSMNLMIIEVPEVTAGADTMLCEGVYSLVEATAVNYQSLLWQTTGDGTFSDPATVNPVYFPGADDLSGNEISLIFNALPYQPCFIGATDSLTLRVLALPWVCAGENQTICAGDIVNCLGQAQNYDQSQWVAFGGNGTFEDPFALITTYTPDQHEIGTGLCYLALMASPNYPCSVSEFSLMKLDINKEPTLELPEQIICIADTVNLLAQPQNHQSCQWTTSGDGTFGNAWNPETVYYAGHNDIEQRHVQLSLVAMPLLSCQLIAADTVQVSFEYPRVLISNMPDRTLTGGEILHMEFEVGSLVPGQYHWFRNGVWQQNISGSEYFIPQVSKIDAGAYYCVFTNPYFSISSDTAHIIVLEPATQTLLIPAGWSAISSCILPPNFDITTVLDPIIDKIIVIYNDSGILFPRTGKGDIDYWATNTGYYIKTTETCTLTLQGYQQFPTPAASVKPGWSLLPVNSLQQIPIANLVGCHPEITAIKEVAGSKVYWSEKGVNTLKNLQPGKAYEIFNSASYRVTILFPGCN